MTDNVASNDTEVESTRDLEVESARTGGRVTRRWLLLLALALLVLLVKACVVGGMVQAEARQLAADAAGIPIERVEVVDGLDVRLTGFTEVAARDEAVAAVEALDSSWEVEGLLAEPVDGADEVVAADEPDDVTPSTSAPTTTAVPDLSPAAVTLTPGSGRVVVAGTVGDRASADALLAVAGERFEDSEIVDEIVVDDGVTTDGGTLIVAGQASSDEQRAEWVAGATAIADQADLDLVDEVEVVSVEQQLNALFELDPIEFDTLQATIRDESVPTLVEAAALINANPDAGRLRVVGHTDTDGGAAQNLALSERRAQAVFDYLVDVEGVDPERLETEGRGETELKVDPEITQEDKQRNRRIEWELIE